MLKFNNQYVDNNLQDIREWDKDIFNTTNFSEAVKRGWVGKIRPKQKKVEKECTV